MPATVEQLSTLGVDEVIRRIHAIAMAPSNLFTQFFRCANGDIYPNYFTDLNAMFEAEKRLVGIEEFQKYEAHIEKIMLLYDHNPFMSHTSCGTKAMAYLMTFENR